MVIHCVGCLERLLQHLFRDLCFRRPVFKEIRLKVDFYNPQRGFDSYDIHLENVINEFQRVLRKFYGHFELLDSGDAPARMERYWTVDRVKITGRLPGARRYRRPAGEEHSSTGTDDESGAEDEQDGDEEETVLCYCERPGVRELERRTKSWNVTNMADPDSGQGQDVARAMRHVRPAPDDNQWRISRTLRADYEAAGKSWKRVVVREEIWVGVRMGS